jgi:hypothetical protein
MKKQFRINLCFLVAFVAIFLFLLLLKSHNKKPSPELHLTKVYIDSSTYCNYSLAGSDLQIYCHQKDSVRIHAPDSTFQALRTTFQRNPTDGR